MEGKKYPQGHPKYQPILAEEPVCDWSKVWNEETSPEIKELMGKLKKKDQTETEEKIVFDVTETGEIKTAKEPVKEAEPVAETPKDPDPVPPDPEPVKTDEPETLPDGRKLNEYGEYEFDDGFEEILIALVARDNEFFTKCGQFVKEEYFSSQIARDLCLIVTQYREKYGKEMDKSILKNEVRGKYAQFRHREESLDDYLAAVDRMFDLDISKTAEYAADKVVNFARRRGVKKALRLIAQNVTGKDEDLEAVRGKIEEALDICPVEAPRIRTCDDVDETKGGEDENWIWNGLIAKEDVNTWYAPPGMGKSHLIWGGGNAINRGDDEYLGIKISQTPVTYIDLENTEDVRRHFKRLLGGGQMGLITYEDDIQVPNIDSAPEEFKKFILTLPQGLIVTDTFPMITNQTKFAESKWEADPIIKVLRELCAKGYTFLLIFHSLKADPKTIKCPQELLGRAGHVVAMYQVSDVGAVEEKEVTEESNPNKPKTVFIGTRPDLKSRHKKYTYWLKVDLNENSEEKGFRRIDDPLEAVLQDVNQRFWEWVENEKSAKGELSMKDYPSKTKFEKLVEEWGYGKIAEKIIKKGLTKYWATDKDEKDRKRGQSAYYFPVKKVENA